MNKNDRIVLDEIRDKAAESLTLRKAWIKIGDPRMDSYYQDEVGNYLNIANDLKIFLA